MDHTGTERVEHVEDLPYGSVLCYARALRHPWPDGHYVKNSSFGGIDAREAVMQCQSCRRRKREVINGNTGAPLVAPQYTGGCFLAVGSSFPSVAARLELIRRQDVPARVVVAEYVDVAHAFLDKDETGMVNAVLDQLARQLRASEFERAG